MRLDIEDSLTGWAFGFAVDKHGAVLLFGPWMFTIELGDDE